MSSGTLGGIEFSQYGNELHLSVKKHTISAEKRQMIWHVVIEWINAACLIQAHC